MASPAGPAETRAFILERLVGETGEPERIVSAARHLAERAAPAIATRLEELISLPFGVSLATVDIGRMADARPQEGSPSAMCVAGSTASPDALVVVLDPAAIAILVALVFGGEPLAGAEAPQRPLSAVEQEIATKALHAVVEAVNGSGPRSLGVRLPAPPALTGADMQKQALRDGPAVRIVFSIFAGAASGHVTVTMPQRLMLKPRGEGGAANEAAQDGGWGSRFSDEVMRSKVRLDATVPLARMTLGEIGRLAPGQVIELPASAQAETRLSARDKTLFVCEFGKLGQNYTVRIRKPFDAGEDLINGLVRR